MGHCALRTYVMGQRAFTDEATEDDLAKMVHLTKEAVAAGAHGFSTTRSVNHQTSDDKPVASRLATWHEFETLVKAMGAGMVEVAGEPRGAESAQGARSTTKASASLPSRAAGRSPSACSTGAPARAVGARPSTSSSARRAGWAHVRPGAQPGAERAALVRDPAAVRQVGRVERDAHQAARRTEEGAPRSRHAPPSGRDRVQALRGPGGARHRGAAAGVGLASTP